MHKSRTSAAAAVGASYLAGKESITGSGNARFLAQSAWRFQKSAPAAMAVGASYLAGKKSINGSGNARFLAQPAWRFEKSAPAAAAAGVKKPHH